MDTILSYRTRGYLAQLNKSWYSSINSDHEYTVCKTTRHRLDEKCNIFMLVISESDSHLNLRTVVKMLKERGIDLNDYIAHRVTPFDETKPFQPLDEDMLIKSGEVVYQTKGPRIKRGDLLYIRGRNVYEIMSSGDSMDVEFFSIFEFSPFYFPPKADMSIIDLEEPGIRSLILDGFNKNNIGRETVFIHKNVRYSLGLYMMFTGLMGRGGFKQILTTSKQIHVTDLRDERYYSDPHTMVLMIKK